MKGSLVTSGRLDIEFKVGAKGSVDRFLKPGSRALSFGSLTLKIGSKCEYFAADNGPKCNGRSYNQ